MKILYTILSRCFLLFVASASLSKKYPEKEGEDINPVVVITKY